MYKVKLGVHLIILLKLKCSTVRKKRKPETKNILCKQLVKNHRYFKPLSFKLIRFLDKM